MSFLSSLSQSIFLRIYIGLLLVCLLVAFFAQLLISTINTERVQTYREDMASATFYLLEQGLLRQPDMEQKQFWLADAGRLFDAKFDILPVEKVDLKASEIKRLEKAQAVVHSNHDQIPAEIFYQLAKPPEPTVNSPSSTVAEKAADTQRSDEKEVLVAKLNKVSEQQIKAVGVLLLDELSYFPTLEEKKQRLAQLQQHFSFPLGIVLTSTLDLDPDQKTRLLRKEVVIVFRDNNGGNGSSIQVLSPLDEGQVAVLGPIPLFNWFPLNLIVSVILISMFLISLGVYTLIFPLERKLQLIQTGINKVQEGKLDTKVKVIGIDEIAQLATTFNNMTEHIRRLIESQRELTRAVSHELRTPVARIRFAVDMLADTDDEESRFMQRDYIDQDIEALNGLIDEILTYAKLEEGSPKLDFEAVNLKELVEQIVRETNALGKPVTVFAGEIDPKAEAEADKRYLHRVLQNLAGNATRYAEGKIVITAGIDKKEAYICVEDDGQGIPEKDREKVFIPFARLDDSRTRASGGYGLGLSIVSRIAFWFNGRMSVDESPELGGARFMMRWPIVQLHTSIIADNLTQKSIERSHSIYNDDEV